MASLARRTSFLVPLLLAACRLGTEGATGAGSGPAVVPTATDVGRPQGPPVSGTFDAAGGVVGSPDGAVRLTVPPGAVSAPTAFTVTPISSRAPGAVGSAYRIEAGGPFRGQLEVSFRGLGSYPLGLDARSLGIRFQDARGFWREPEAVRRDTAGDSIAASTSHLTDWALVLTAPPALEGTFTLDQGVGIPFSATGTAALYAVPDGGEPTYLLTGTITVPAELTRGTSTCVPDPPTQVLEPSVAEVHASVFRWGINGRWAVTCTDSATGGVSSGDLATLFDTMQINLGRCAGRYLGTQVNGPAAVQGSYASDCGTEGQVIATWSFRGCSPGGSCLPDDPCRSGTVSCSLGVGTCTPGAPLPPGSACGAAEVCDAAGACVACATGQLCLPATACTEGITDCSTGAPLCADTLVPLPDGTVCSTAAVPAGSCLAGVCQPG